MRHHQSRIERNRLLEGPGRFGESVRRHQPLSFAHALPRLDLRGSIGRLGDRRRLRLRAGAEAEQQQGGEREANHAHHWGRGPV